MSTFMKVLLGLGAAVVAYKVVKPALASASDYKARTGPWYAGRPGDTTGMTTRPGREQFDLPPGARFEPGYTPPEMDI